MSSSIFGRTPEPEPSGVRAIFGAFGVSFLVFIVCMTVVAIFDIRSEVLLQGIGWGSILAGLSSYKEIKKRLYKAWEKREAERESAQF